MKGGRTTPVLLEALEQVAAVLEEQEWRHVFIGGIALAAWGKARTTVDIDLMIFGSDDQATRIIEALAGKGFGILGEIQHDVMMSGFRVRRVFRKAAGSSQEIAVVIDVLLSSNPVVEEIIRQSCRRNVGPVTISVPRAEDYIVLKLQAGRMQDLADAQAVYQAQKDSIDPEYLRSRADQFAVSDLLERISNER